MEQYDKNDFQQTLYLVSVNDNETSYTILKKFQADNPKYFPVYYYLADLCPKVVKEYDLLQQYHEIMTMLNDAKKYYDLSLYYLNFSGVKSDRKYFTNINPAGKKLETSDIISDVNLKKQEIETYINKIKTVYTYYSNAVYNYHTCIEKFRNIVAEYETEKSVLFIKSDDLLLKLDSIEKNFDSTLIYFNLYRSAIDTFPIGNYKQEFHLRAIETYRLDGLTQSNFLQNSIELWDFKSWIYKIRTIKTTDINDLFSIAVGVENKLRDTEKRLVADSIISYNKIIESRFLNFAKKFDFNTILEDYFLYREQNLAYRNLINSSLNKENPQYNDINRVYNYYCNTLNNAINHDNLITTLLNKCNESNFTKNAVFFNEFYKSAHDLKENIIYNDNFVKNNTKYVLSNFKTILNPKIDDSITVKTSYQIIDYKNNVINNEHIIYGSCIIKNDTLGFILKADTTGKIHWDVHFDISYINADSTEDKSTINSVSAFTSANNLCFAVVSSAVNNFNIQNTLFIIDLKNGSEQKQIKLSSQNHCKYIKYDDLNQEILLGFKPNTLNHTSYDIEVASIKGEKLFKSSFDISGNIFDISKVSGNHYMIFGNFNTLSLSSTQMVNLSENQYAVFSIVLAGNGTIKNGKTYQNNISYYGTSLIRFNENELFVIGSEFDQTGFSTGSIINPIFIKLNSERDLIYSSVEE